MNVLLVGGGSREHAIAWKLRQSPRLGELFTAPGNAGTALLGQNLDIKANDEEGIVQAARDHRIDLVVVGPEEPLVRGLVDRLTGEGIPAFGPSRAAATIEGSKAFAKELCQGYGIPHASGTSFTNRTDARNYVRSLSTPPVVKADGLAAGKGAFVCDSQEEALAAIEAMMVDAIFGDAGRTVVIEERLSGRELSTFAFSDGQTVFPLVPACDYKRARDGDQGPNTGGMGSYSPPPWYDDALESSVRRILETAVQAMAQEGRPYRGVLYPGLMITDDGPRVMEFNCRLGDPETQVILPRLKSGLLDILWAVVNNRLHEATIEWSEDACVGVVLTSGGYPDEYRTGYPIAGLGSIEPDVLVFHAGTQPADDGSVVTTGGRVLTVVATAPTLAAARAKAYRNVQHIHFTNLRYRTDIAAPAEGARVD